MIFGGTLGFRTFSSAGTSAALAGFGRITDSKVTGPPEIQFNFVATTEEGLMLLEKLKSGQPTITARGIPDPKRPEAGFRLDLLF